MSPSEPPDAQRLRDAFARLSDEPGGPDADAERVFSALHGDMSAEERRRVVDELVRNPQAAAAWRLARELEPERSVQSGQAWKWLSVAALLVIAAGAVWQFRLFQSEVPPVYRSAEPDTISSLLPQDVPLSRRDPVLKWTAVDGARYRVRVLTPALAPLVEAEDLTVPEYRLPDDVLRQVAPGGRIVWQVEARVSGARTRISPTYVVELID